jgi:predicted dehydrogenase
VRSSVDASLAGWKPLAPGFATQFRLFWDSLAEGKPLPVTLEDARRALALVAAVYRSQETQRQEMLA